MPELPDLHAFSQNLSKTLVGKTIEKTHAMNRKKLNASERDLQRALEGAIVSSVYRDGKELHMAFVFEWFEWLKGLKG